jgi:hypothetical protein
MLRRSVCAAVVALVLGGFVLAETINVVITKIEGDKVTGNIREKGKKEKGAEKSFTLTDKTEFLRRKGKDAEPEKASKDDLLKAAEKNKEKGLNATLDVDGTKINKITFGGRGGKKKDAN